MTDREYKAIVVGILVVVALVLAIVITLMWPTGAPAQTPRPGYGYKGRPPADIHYPGRCWCVIHGPRGGCKHWQCRPKVR